MYVRELDGDPPVDHTKKCSHPLCKNRVPCHGEFVHDEDGGGCRDCERWELCESCEARAAQIDAQDMVKELAEDLADVLGEQPDEIAASLNRSLEE
jgi:hypothetical protein